MILGGGLSGLAVARALEAQLKPLEREAVKITLVSRSGHLTLSPLLALAAAGRLSPDLTVSALQPRLLLTAFARRGRTSLLARRPASPEFRFIGARLAISAMRGATHSTGAHA